MTATVKANSDGSADLLVNTLAAIHMAADGGVSFPKQGQEWGRVFRFSTLR